MAIPWHRGELEVHRLLAVPTQLYNPTYPGLPASYGFRIAESPLLALGTLDDQNRPWTTLWGGERGFARPVTEGVLGVRTAVELGDPVLNALFDDKIQKDVVLKPENPQLGRVFSALAIDLESRDRVKLSGRFAAGAVTELSNEGHGEVQIALAVKESLGNCPKYLNKRAVESRIPRPGNARKVLPLSPAALEVIAQADMFFLSTSSGETMDTNHRGGSKGFIRVANNEDGVTELVYPEFSGNRLYQTLGNLQINPKIGITVPNYETSDVLYVRFPMPNLRVLATGSAQILVGPDAASYVARTNIAVKITLDEAIFVPGGLPFVSPSAAVEFSPYNPPLRTLMSEGTDAALAAGALAMTTATLTGREELTPTINRLTFHIPPSSPLLTWRAGQHVTLDFSAELDHGWSHMRDSDPQSLNDDFVRTFTVSSAPNNADASVGVEFQITVRRYGPVTSLLAKHNLRGLPLDVPVRGVGGKPDFSMSRLSADDGTRRVFVAGGVGITPLLAQAPGLIESESNFGVVWALRAEDLALAVDAFELSPGLAERTNLLVSGSVEDEAARHVSRLHAQGLGRLERRRMIRSDVLDSRQEQKAKYYLCASPMLLKELREWLDGEDTVWEDFNY